MLAITIASAAVEANSATASHNTKVILGGTLTSGADGKSSTNALGNVHNEVRKDLRDGDIRQANTTLTRDLVFAIASINGLAQGGLRRCPQFRLNAQEREDLATFSEALPPLVDMGIRPPVAWVHERLPDVQADLLFSCPPYGNLERYSDDKADLSTMRYPRFLRTYRQIIKEACGHAAPRPICLLCGGRHQGHTGPVPGIRE